MTVQSDALAQVERERRHAIEAVRVLGGDPSGREEEGRYHSVFYTSRPSPMR
ncbi:hypothetical protein [Streptomyces eurythermus]|uniref:hypothetical protein n=1 Tax=Streptomyces eurythermus TaxID=42237 RepID=UPI0036FDDB91